MLVEEGGGVMAKRLNDDFSVSVFMERLYVGKLVPIKYTMRTWLADDGSAVLRMSSLFFVPMSFGSAW